MKFLGLHIFSRHQFANSAKHLESKLEDLLAKVDQMPLRAAYRIDIYKSYVLSCIRFDLAVCEIWPTRLEALDRIVRKQIRKWIKMAPSAHTGHLFHSAGLDLPLPSHAYIHGHASTLLRDTSDDKPLEEAIEITKCDNSIKCDAAIQASAAASSTSDLSKIVSAMSD